MVNHFLLQDWDVQCSKSEVTLRLIVRNRNVTSLFRRPLRRIESLAGGMVSERDLQAHGIMGSVTCYWWRCVRDCHVRCFCGEGDIVP